MGVLLLGPSGAGKSDLALRLIDSGAVLVADDQVVLERIEDVLEAGPPAALAGLLEVRGLGLVRLEYRMRVTVGLVVDLDTALKTERLPEFREELLLGLPIPSIALRAFEASAPAKVRLVARGLDLHSAC